MAASSDSGVGNSFSGPIHQGQPDSWTLVREGFKQPIFSLQKHMPEISVGRSTECMLSCPGTTVQIYITNQSFCSLLEEH